MFGSEGLHQMSLGTEAIQQEIETIATRRTETKPCETRTSHTKKQESRVTKQETLVTTHKER